MIKHYKNLHNYDVYSLDISKDNTKFVTGGGDKNVIMTDVIEGKSVRKYTGHTARINSVCFNQDNNVIVLYDAVSLVLPTIPLFDAGTIEMMLIILLTY